MNSNLHIRSYKWTGPGLRRHCMPYTWWVEGIEKDVSAGIVVAQIMRWSCTPWELYLIPGPNLSQVTCLSPPAPYPTTPGERQAPSTVPICIQWNREDCSREVCHYRHACSTCPGDHRASECPKTEPDSFYKRASGCRQTLSPANSWKGGPLIQLCTVFIWALLRRTDAPMHWYRYTDAQM